MMKLLGAILILLSCGSVGFMMVAAYRYQEQSLLQLIKALDYMMGDLQCRLSSLPDLCRGASQVCSGCVKSILQELSLELEKQMIPNASACMYAVTSRATNIPEILCNSLALLGDTLGRFDLAGQVKGLESTKRQVQFTLDQLRNTQDAQLRSYKTLGLCAGAALVVLFL